MPDKVLEEIALWRKPLLSLYPDLRWTSSENQHLTLRFLGNREPESVVKEIEQLNLGFSLPVSFTLERCGTFGRPPSVLWLSGKFAETCYHLASRLAGIVDENGEMEKRRFFPHITVARSPRGRAIPRIDFKDKIHGSSAGIELISSTLTSRGPIYRTLFGVSEQSAH